MFCKLICIFNGQQVDADLEIYLNLMLADCEYSVGRNHDSNDYLKYGLLCWTLIMQVSDHCIFYECCPCLIKPFRHLLRKVDHGNFRILLYPSRFLRLSRY